MMPKIREFHLRVCPVVDEVVISWTWSEFSEDRRMIAMLNYYWFEAIVRMVIRICL